MLEDLFEVPGRPGHTVEAGDIGICTMPEGKPYQIYSLTNQANAMYVLRKITFGTSSIPSTTERELSVWKKWFLKVARPPSSTGMRRPQERREMNTATGKDTSLRTDVTPAIVGQ